jgi:5-methylcytosine-specific restriction endonuclease McrA
MTRLSACLGCGTLVAPGPRCYRCRRAWERQYDGGRPAHHALYATPEWRKLSAEVRASATRCYWCCKPTRRLVADHVIPLEARPDLALDRDNLRPACFACNTRRGRNARLPDLAPANHPAASTSRPARPGTSGGAGGGTQKPLPAPASSPSTAEEFWT